ncbi:HNH endonuclease [Schinkia azotoformans]|uniref:HNH endonuclease n=1 Tax=Schinkia azotoformans TaxID=1454 RepID=UPI002DB620C2|nr:HNH endonuclease [Schinkia azotoformans]MEC1778419.1 HNH endonuclease [Schinkia azotoformans]MED4328336.1 HNH endonuclease [Schinkia azotoformans]
MKNDYCIKGDVVEVYFRYKGEKKIFTISISKLDKMRNHEGSWFGGLDRNSGKIYIYSKLKRENGKQKSILLHRFLTDCPKGLVVDHINGNTLNNTDENIRVCTVGQNNQNLTKLRKDNKAGFRGVSWNSRHGKWYSSIKLNGKTKHLGSFDNKDDAIKVRVEAEKKYFTHSQIATKLAHANKKIG